MKTQENTSIPDFSELREQLATFKQRLDEQQIINDRLMRRSMKARISPFQKTSIASDAMALVLSPILFVVFRKLGVHWGFGAFFVLMVLIELLFNIYNYYRISDLFTQPTDLLTMRRGLLSFRRAERLWMATAIPGIFLWLGLIWWQMGAFSNFHEGLIYGCIGVVLGLIVCFFFYTWQMRRVREVERELDELSE